MELPTRRSFTLAKVGEKNQNKSHSRPNPIPGTEAVQEKPFFCGWKAKGCFTPALSRSMLALRIPQGVSGTTEDHKIPVGFVKASKGREERRGNKKVKPKSCGLGGRALPLQSVSPAGGGYTEIPSEPPRGVPELCQGFGEVPQSLGCLGRLLTPALAFPGCWSVLLRAEVRALGGEAKSLALLRGRQREPRVPGCQSAGLPPLHGVLCQLPALCLRLRTSPPALPGAAGVPGRRYASRCQEKPWQFGVSGCGAWKGWL